MLFILTNVHIYTRRKLYANILTYKVQCTWLKYLSKWYILLYFNFFIYIFNHQWGSTIVKCTPSGVNKILTIFSFCRRTFSTCKWFIKSMFSSLHKFRRQVLYFTTIVFIIGNSPPIIMCLVVSLVWSYYRRHVHQIEEIWSYAEINLVVWYVVW